MTTPEAEGQLSVLDVMRDGAHTLELTGELDIASYPVLEAAAGRLMADGARSLTVDLHDLQFMDLAGLRAVLEVHERAEEVGCQLRLIPGPWQVQSLFERTGLAKMLPFQVAGGGCHLAAEQGSRS
ncbi:MAG TPA: STAS domain-containing protein [Solirubrobacteraceae bacterium]|jgi:anti-anti-sigma factor